MKIHGVDEVYKVVEYTEGITANGYVDVIQFKVPENRALEIDYIGVIPDLDFDDYPHDSNLNYLEVLVEDTGLEGFKFSINGYHKNMLPWGGQYSKRPPLKFGELMTPGSTTLKLAEGQTIKLRVWAGSENVTSPFFVSLHGYLYEDWKVKQVFNVTPADFDGIAGGWNQGKPGIYFWCTYATNSSNTTPNEWYKIYSMDVGAKRQYIIDRVGVVPASHSKQTWFRLDGTEWTPKYPYDTTRLYNTLPFGDDADLAGPYRLEPPIELHRRTFEVFHKDDGTSIPAGEVMIALYGTRIELK